jgi:protein-disulfide isomerase
MEDENKIEKKEENTKNDSSKQIAGAIIIAGLIIAGAILLKGNSAPSTEQKATIQKVTSSDNILGDPKAKISVVLYADFQCPFCGAIAGLDMNSPLIQALKQRDPSWTPFLPDLKKYIDGGSVNFVYRDYAFLGPESVRSAEGARCAGDQNKFWEYHDYLYGHQKGENEGAFSDANLKAFAKILNLNTDDFNNCLDGGKYAQAVADSKTEGDKSGVTGTPKGFILKKGKIVGTIEGAEPSKTVIPKIEAALK